LIDAKRRGVDVRIIVDSGGNQTAASKAALNLVVNAGIPTRTINVYPIHHDKYMVIDESSIQTGSMNYTKGGETRNSENTLAVRACPRLARLYLDHWANRWDKGVDARSSY
jgi:phosphatidylserine/phosphatidylglycerophosphate/cardiolipin synthase-like enzyme